MTRSFSLRWPAIVILLVGHIPCCVSFVLKCSCLHSSRSSIPRRKFQNRLFFEPEDESDLPVVDDFFAESPPTEIPSERLPILPALLGVVAFTAFWPLLAFLRFENPVGYNFDVDTFLALQGILGMNDAGNMMQDPGAVTEIIELPGLSPAEQVVAAFFGPPPSSTR